MVTILVYKSGKKYYATNDVNDVLCSGQYEQNVIMGVMRYLRNVEFRGVVLFYRPKENLPFLAKTLIKDSVNG